MADAIPLPVDEKKPAVYILVLQPVPEKMMTPILWGVEEEGIPAEVGEAVSGSAEALAKQAANGSPLNVGIGIDPGEPAVVLHHRDLPAGKPLVSLGAGELQPLRLRQLGVNAARLVKGEPLVLQDGAALNSGGQDVSAPSYHDVEELQALIVQVVTELLKKE